MAIITRCLWSALNLGGLSVREAARRTWKQINDHEIMTRAAAVSFYAIAALVPFLALVITLTAYCLPWIPRAAGSETSAFAGPLEPLRNLIPPDAVSIVARELRRLQEQPSTGVISLGLVATLWFSSSFFVAIMDAMNRIMGVEETRPIWKQRLVALLMTLGQAAIWMAALATIAIWPQIVRWLGLSRAGAILATVLHGLAVFFMTLLSFAVAMYFGPAADQRWEWITPGSLVGTPLVLLVSYLFRIYVQNWGNYTATYGSLGGIIALMSWLWLCGLVLLAAAVLNRVVKDASPLANSPGKECGSPLVHSS